MNRRQVLTRTAPLLTTAVGVTGCLSLGDDGESTLGTLSIVNRSEEAQTVDVRVRWGDELVHESTHELDGASNGSTSATPAKTWPDEPGQFTLSARNAGGDWQTVDPADREYPACYAVIFQVTAEGRLSNLIGTDEHECSDEALASNRDAVDES